MVSQKAKDEDLKLKFLTPDEVFWTGIKERSEQEIKICENGIKLNKELVKTAELKIKEEQAKTQEIK